MSSFDLFLAPQPVVEEPVEGLRANLDSLRIEEASEGEVCLNLNKVSELKLLLLTSNFYIFRQNEFTSIPIAVIELPEEETNIRAKVTKFRFEIQHSTLFSSYLDP